MKISSIADRAVLNNSTAMPRLWLGYFAPRKERRWSARADGRLRTGTGVEVIHTAQGMHTDHDDGRRGTVAEKIREGLACDYRFVPPDPRRCCQNCRNYQPIDEATGICYEYEVLPYGGCKYFAPKE